MSDHSRINIQGEVNNELLKSAISDIDRSVLPLQKGLEHSSYVSESPWSPVILNTQIDDSTVKVKTGIFYSGIIAGCSCADDPSPQDEVQEYCEVMFVIDRNTGEYSVSLIEE